MSEARPTQSLFEPSVLLLWLVLMVDGQWQRTPLNLNVAKMSRREQQYAWFLDRIKQHLERRQSKESLRQLPAVTASSSAVSGRNAMDFSSNDYLGLSQDVEQQKFVNSAMNALHRDHRKTGTPYSLGATGSRLLSGDSWHFHKLEQRLATIHNAESALLCNSGYDANLSVVSCLPCDCILYDEYAHNSLHMGMRLWKSVKPSESLDGTRPNKGSDRIIISFRHNCLLDLRAKLQKLSEENSERRVVILIESVYSMDGDIAPVHDILDLALEFNAMVVVDEAHGLGITNEETGTGVLSALRCERHPALAYVIYTFGKAAGCHGAAIVCPVTAAQKEYLINFAYPIIYSTALPLHSLITIQCAYSTIMSHKGRRLRQHLRQLIEQFQRLLSSQLQRILAVNKGIYLLPSSTPIQALIVPGNVACTEFCRRLLQRSGQMLRLYPIKSPTVPVGLERVRIVLHAHNTLDQVHSLIHFIVHTVEDEKKLVTTTRQQHFSKL